MSPDEERADARIRKALHLGNITLHLLCVIQIHVFFGLIPALLFAVHPLAASPVTYISARGSLLAAVFAIPAIGLMMHGLWWAALPLAVLACLAKEDSVILFPLLALAGFLSSSPLWWTALIPLAGSVLLLKKEPLIHGASKPEHYRTKLGKLLLNSGHRQMEACGFPASPRTPQYQWISITAHLGRLPFWAFGLCLCPQPDLRWPEDRLKLAGIVLYAAVGASVSYAAAFFYPLAAALVWLPILPYLLIPIHDPILEPRYYLPTLGICLILAQLPYPWLLIPGFFGISRFRIWYWSDRVQLWTASATSGGRLDFAYVNTGAAYHEKGRKFDYLAAQHFRKAITVNPKMAHPWCNLAMITLMDGRDCLAEGKPEAALAKFQEAAELTAGAVRGTPLYEGAWDMHGRMLEACGREREAQAAYTRALACSHGYAFSWNRLGLIWAKRQRLGLAQGCFYQAHTLKPTEMAFAYNYAAIQKLNGAEAEAVLLFKTLPREIPLNAEMLVFEKAVS